MKRNNGKQINDNGLCKLTPRTTACVLKLLQLKFFAYLLMIIWPIMFNGFREFYFVRFFKIQRNSLKVCMVQMIALELANVSIHKQFSMSDSSIVQWYNNGVKYKS